MQNSKRIYEVMLTVRVEEQTVEGARAAADSRMKENGQAAGRLQIVDRGADGTREGEVVFLGHGSSYATLDGLFEDEPQANLNGLFEDEEAEQ